MRYTIWIALLVVGLSGLAIEARACSCAGLTLEQQIESADYAFAGLVIDVDTIDNQFLKATIDVHEVWKGTVTKRFHVWTYIRSASCGYNDPWARFEIGVKFVLYAFNPNEWIDEIYTHLCTRNKKYDEATGDLAILGHGQTPLATEEDAVPTKGAILGAAYPNPSSGSAVIPFTLSKPGWVELTIHDVLGRELTTLAAGYYGGGSYEVMWSSGREANGVYFYRLRIGEAVIVRILILDRR